MKSVTGRDIAAMLNPRLAVLVTCCDAAGKPNVLTVAWHTPLSHQPPLVGISIGHTRYSHRLIQEQGQFVIHVMGIDRQKAIGVCGLYTGEMDDKLAIAGLETHPAKMVQPPVLADALGVLECEVVQAIETGDHTFFIGEVLHASACEHGFKSGWKSESEDPVLLCLQRSHFGAFVDVNRNGK